MPYGNIVTSITAPSAELHVSFMVSEKNQDFQMYQYYKSITYKPQVTISSNSVLSIIASCRKPGAAMIAKNR